jgi:tripartite-type tricarboxylate transporter receptor subunit TctC
MKRLRCAFLNLTASAAALPAVSRLAWPQDYPSRLVMLIVGFAPGDPTDIPTRLMANMPSARLGQRFIADNQRGR